MIHETFHRPPGIKQSHAVVVKYIAVLIPRILVVPRLKRKGSVNEIEIQIVEPQSFQASLKSWFDTRRPVIGVPQLCGNKNVPTRNPSSGESFLQSLANLALVPVSFRAIEVSKPGFQRIPCRSYRHGSVRN